jgi:hypothetical protein
MMNSNLYAGGFRGRQTLCEHHFVSANQNAGTSLDVAIEDEVFEDLILPDEDESLDMRDLLLDDAD